MGPLALSRVASLVLQAPYGQVRVPDELKKRAISASPAGARTIWPRRDLQTLQQRLKSAVGVMQEDQ